MKKILVIPLLILHLFNITGYTFIYQYSIEESDKKIIIAIDKFSYDKADLTELKLPLNMPYLSNSNYERINGEIELNGVQYNYVQRKVCNDTLYLMCLPNLEKTQLYIAKTDFAKAANDLPQGKHNTGSLVKKGGITLEYTKPSLHNFNNNITAVSNQHVFTITKISSGFISLTVQPPDTSC